MAKVGDRYAIEIDCKTTGRAGTQYGVKDLPGVWLKEEALKNLEKLESAETEKDQEGSRPCGSGDADNVLGWLEVPQRIVDLLTEAFASVSGELAFIMQTSALASAMDSISAMHEVDPSRTRKAVLKAGMKVDELLRED